MARTSYMGTGYKEELNYPCGEDTFEGIEYIIRELRRDPVDYLLVNLKGYPNKISFIQTDHNDGEEPFLIEIGLDTGQEHPQMFRLVPVSLEDCIDVFHSVCVEAEEPDYFGWKDITREIFYRTVTMKIFKVAYKVVRENSSEIYKGFGFKHLSDATQFYVHPDNQSYKGTTTLCQPIGESVILFAEMLRSIAKGTGFGDYYTSDDGKTAYLEVNIPEDYRVNAVVDNNIFRYRALAKDNSITIAAYDENNRWIEGYMDHLHPLYKLLPVFMVLLGREMGTNNDFRSIMDGFIDQPAADSFVNVHEDFYQNHKAEEYEVTYEDLADVDTEGMRSYSASFDVIRENRKDAGKKEENPIVRFPDDAFSSEQRELISSHPKDMKKSRSPFCNSIHSAGVHFCFEQELVQ